MNDTLENPLCLFRSNSFHGGVWRTGYTLDSLGPPSGVYFLRNKLYMGLAVVGGIVAFVLNGFGFP